MLWQDGGKKASATEITLHCLLVSPSCSQNTCTVSYKKHQGASGENGARSLVTTDYIPR